MENCSLAVGVLWAVYSRRLRLQCLNLLPAPVAESHQSDSMANRVPTTRQVSLKLPGRARVTALGIPQRLKLGRIDLRFESNIDLQSESAGTGAQVP